MNKVRVYIYDISNAPFRVSALDLIEEKRKQEILTGKNYLYRLRSLYAGLLIRHALKAEGEVISTPIEFVYNEFGKPYIKDGNKYISVTHSGNIVAVAVADVEIGLDAEIMQNKVYTHIADKVLSKKEMKEYQTYTDGDSIKYFLSHWVIKESYSKCVGTGIRKLPCDVEPEGNTVNGLYYVATEFKYKNYSYFMAVTSGEELEVERISVGRISMSKED